MCALVRSRIALIAMHTNYDNAAPGVNDALAARLRLENVAILDNGMRMGDCQACTLSEFAVHVENCLGGPVRRYGDPCRIIRRVAVLGGAGEDFACQALSAVQSVISRGDGLSYGVGCGGIPLVYLGGWTRGNGEAWNFRAV